MQKLQPSTTQKHKLKAYWIGHLAKMDATQKTASPSTCNKRFKEHGRNPPSVGVVFDCLRENFAASHVLDGKLKTFTVLQILLWNVNKIFILSRWYIQACNERRIHLCGLAPGQHSSEETWQRWRAVDDTVFDLSGQGIKPRTFRAKSDVSNHYANREVPRYGKNTNFTPNLPDIAFKLACCISECLAQIIFPLLSIDIAGSSRPILIIKLPSS